MKKAIAKALLIVSLIGFIAQYTHMYFLSDVLEVMGPRPSPLVILVAFGLIPYSSSSLKKGWLQ